jgi:hypothetical protein
MYILYVDNILLICVEQVEVHLFWSHELFMILFYNMQI